MSESGLGVGLKFILWMGSEVGLGKTVSVEAGLSLVITKLKVSLRIMIRSVSEKYVLGKCLDYG